ncbi:hypothetical protein GOP47_0010915 [Adiantum capillus-veneris]|uniref:RING-type E3 ubiquitin transferase n=1 Tax=Adiantum capillus-veneris TaxID=13818 RepID=A0A9D4UW66_ADICA|nr:hypothetical protein GOP47_0010915 [Adiantum capillus-veneris]
MASSDTRLPRPQEDDDSALFENYSMNGKIIISALGILFCMVFIIVVLHMYAKWCWRRRSNMQRRALSRLRSSLSSSAQETHKASGLDKEVVEALPIFAYTPQVFRGANLGATAKAVECAVCLAEFRQGESCKLLPKCKHSFHAVCIDLWFLSHATCPLCRATPGLLVVDEEAGYALHHHEDGSCDEQFDEAQRVRRCMHGGRLHTTCGDDEQQDFEDDDSLLSKGASSEPRKWRRSFSDKFPCTAREAVPSSGNAYMASPMGLSQVTTDNPRRQDRLVVFSSCSSISSLVSPHRVLPHPHVYPPLVGEPKGLTRVLST